MVFTPYHASEKNDAPFNMASLFYLRINELLGAKDKAAISDDLKSYYSCLEAVFNNIFFQIRDEDKIEEILALFKKALGQINTTVPQGVDRKVAAQAASLSFWNARATLTEIDRELMVLMDKRKMIFPRMEINTGIEGVRKSLGLDK